MEIIAILTNFGDQPNPPKAGTTKFDFLEPKGGLEIF